MKATCPSCNANLNIDDKKIPAGGARIKCPTCQNIFPVRPGGAVPLPGATSAPAATNTAVPLPGAAAPAPRIAPPPTVSQQSGAVPLPGAAAAPSAADTEWEDAPTRMQPAYIPPEAVPGATTRAAPPSNIGIGDDGMTRPVAGGRSGAVPLPGITASAPAATGGDWQDESTRIADIPVPREAYSEPPSAHVDFSSFEQAPTGAVPLPGASEAPATVKMSRGAVPLPGSGSYQPTHVGPTPGSYDQTHAGAVPLPGASKKPSAFDLTNTGAPNSYDQTYAGAVPLPGAARAAAAAPASSSYESTHAGAVPLPGHAAPTRIERAMPASARTVDGAVPLPGHADAPAPEASWNDSAVPLPGNGGSVDNATWSRGVPLPGHAEPTQMGNAYTPHHDATQFGDAPSFDDSTQGSSTGLADVPEASGFDFAEVPQAPQFDTQSTTSFDLPPEPEPAAAPGFDFADLPSPAEPASGGFELDNSRPPEVPNLPSPSAPPPGVADTGFDFSESAAPQANDAYQAPVNPSFGEVDLGGGDSLEFDPSAKPKQDEYEADLSQPLPPPKAGGPADGLEMLSFIDDTAKEHGAALSDTPSARRFHIKRRSGKVFGPFEEAVVVKMLEDGQLLGNEEVSLDSESWAPIGGESSFQSAIAKLMEQPARASGAASAPQPSAPNGGVAGGQNRAAPPSMERLKQLYEGRMAAVAVVQGKDPVPFIKRVPYIVAGVLLLSIIVAGAWSSTTRYGIFGLKVLFPARVSSNSEEFRTLNEAKKDLLVDTFKGYKASKDLCDKLLRTKQYPEVRAVWIQAVYYLDRKYGAASAADLQTAEAEQENIMLLGEKHAEVVKALAGAAIHKKDYDRALSLVASARARSDNEGDVELLFLKAEALAAKNQIPLAMTDLKAVLEKQKDSARALHTMAMLHLKQKEVDLAAGNFQDALTASPEHVSSAVELANIELNDRKDTAKGTALLDQALADDKKMNLAPGELGRALAMKAQVLAGQKKLDEAVELFEAALKADPENVYAKAAYGGLLNERHDFAKALPMLKDAATKTPDSLPYIEEYLNALVGVGKMDEATNVMKAAESRFPGNARIAFLSGRIDDGMDRTKQAEENYKKSISADPKMVEANIALASLYLRLHRFGDAKPQLLEAVQKAPDNAMVHVGLGELALAESDTDKADDELRKAADLNPNLPGAFLGLSKVALAQGKFDVAESQATKALKLDPRIQDGRLQMGTVLWKLGRYDDALKELEQAKQDDPRSISVPITLGAVNFDKGDMDAATGNLLGALQKDAGNADANFYMAKVKNKRAEHTQAIEFMKKALDHSPRRVEFHYWLGNIYFDARKGNEAVDEWKAALAIDPKYADALEALGRNSLSRNKYKEAIDYFEKVLDSDPGRIRMQAAIGDAWSSNEQWDKAITAYLKALQADPGLAEVYPKLATAYQEKKKWADAITWYRKATQHDPTNGQAWLNLGYALQEKHQNAEGVEAFKHFLENNTDPKMKKEIEDQIQYLKNKSGGGGD